MAIPPEKLKELLHAEAVRLGFAAFGVAGTEAPLRRAYFEQWLADGRHGGMTWLERNNDRRLAPKKLLATPAAEPRARSLVFVGMNYFQTEPPRRYRIAKYALGRDYHNLMVKRLRKLAALLRTHGGEARTWVDTGPVLEKPLAAQAGLGWQGKNTLLIHPKLGTWLLLGVIATDLELPPDHAGRDHCGACTACLDACPTRAITATVTNAEGASVPDTLTWTATSGTITPSADTLSATLDNAAVGTVTVTATDTTGLTASVEFEIVDSTPAAISLTVA
ncbi:MAG TPA: QueG-associated DUF1730 domain-containing protein [Opitutales bacterium]|nr:QueG-associated DUF1730 domain-containing protein [Opitutales bacterium]